MIKLLVLVAGLALILFILWWFFANHEKSGVKAQRVGNRQEVHITVNGGYSPGTVVLEKGIPARLIFNRVDPSPCVDQVVFPDFGVQADLPMKEDYVIDITPDKSGEFGYACGMNMLHGKLVVE